jgi:CubicO group peptidase (beta-lactamase class C family)
VGVERTDPEGRTVLDLHPAQREMTVRDLLLHTAGLTYGFYGRSLLNEAYRVANLWDSNQTSAEFIAKITKLPLANHPGAAWDYGQASDVLGMLLERIEGKPLDAVLEERIFGPLGMKDTGFYVREADLGRLAEPYGPTPLGLIPVSRKPNFLAGGHGLVSTAQDYARFLGMILNGGALDGARVLGKGTVDYMTSNQLVSAVKGGPGYGYGFGLGFGVRVETGTPAYPGTVGDLQWAGYAGTLFWADPRERLAVVFMVQAPTQLSRYSALIRTLVYAALVK